MKTRINVKSFLTLTKCSIVIPMLLAMTLASTGFADTPTPSDEYSSATPGSATTPSDLLKQVEGSFECNNPMCTLFTMTVNKKSFTVTSYAGVGNSLQNAGSGNNYYGTTQNQTGSNAGVPSYGVEVTWDHTTCTKSVVVPNTVQDSVMTYWRNLKNRTPGEDPTFPTFTPAEETMILFFTTVMDLTKGTTCN